MVPRKALPSLVPETSNADPVVWFRIECCLHWFPRLRSLANNYWYDPILVLQCYVSCPWRLPRVLSMWLGCPRYQHDPRANVVDLLGYRRGHWIRHG
ncbi:hypothetical protein B296_00015169 [Ensete ventricosum]|uniref:Uncharacterized protein n=1 Tax=Ensete ventricosum TaxID=4639 RepID=A0A426ZSK7_ENSVE|nr:hypothetical protein B296_00015169 [Ensete ventricosum]